MKQLRVLCLIGQFALLFNPVALAEESGDDSAVYVDNYRFVLTYTSSENKQIDIEFVVSARSFKVSTFEPRLDFQGTIMASESKSLVLQYDLRLQKDVVTGSFAGAENQKPFQTVSKIQGGLTSNIRLRLGAPVEILNVGTESARLTVTKVD
ncbi:MAG: hypothetical protein WAM60_11350 [Candidatus Promineifilaceae bacterium]